MNRIQKQIIRYVNRMKASIAFISKHPLTQGHLFQACFRYFSFHVIQFLRGNRPKKYRFIDEIYFYASMGEAGIVGNIYTGLDDFSEMSFLLHFLNSDDLFVDVGANVGSYTLLASGVCKSQSIAIEPIPDTYNKLMANVLLNNLTDLVECLNVGLGSIETELYFNKTPSAVMSHVSVSGENPNNPQIAVKVMPLDSLVKGKMPSLIKIDVEGFELEVLRGASNCLTNDVCKAIIIELNSMGEKYGVNDSQTLSLLMSYGFKPYQYDPFLRKLIEINANEQKGYNAIFIRDLDALLPKINTAPKRKVLSNWI